VLERLANLSATKVLLLPELVAWKGQNLQFVVTKFRDKLVQLQVVTRSRASV
jgi:hypothetical protein